MPGYDPLSSIMTSLRNYGGTDQRSMEARQGRFNGMRQQMGIMPGGVPANQKPPGMGVGENTASGEQLAVNPADKTSIIVDQMNEIILTIKAQLGVDPDPQRMKYWEGLSNKLRGEVRSLGFDPIAPDESIQEGMAKLQGFGAVGMLQLEEEIKPKGSYSNPQPGMVYLDPRETMPGGFDGGQAQPMPGGGGWGQAPSVIPMPAPGNAGTGKAKTPSQPEVMPVQIQPKTYPASKSYAPNYAGFLQSLVGESQTPRTPALSPKGSVAKWKEMQRQRHVLMARKLAQRGGTPTLGR